MRIALFMMMSSLPINTANAADSAPFAVDSELPGVKSSYTESMIKIARAFALNAPIAVGRKDHPFTGNEALSVRCFSTPGNNLYMGVEQKMEIHAPLEVVQTILDDIDAYEGIFDGLKDVRVTQREKNRLMTHWIQDSPAFFIPNTEFDLIYLLDQSSPNRRIYRYQLAKAGSMKLDDGLIMIERQSAAVTNYYELDFFDAAWGIAASIGENKLWTDVIEGIALSDLPIKLSSENREWSHPKIKEEAKRSLKKFPYDQCIKNRKDWSPLQ